MKKYFLLLGIAIVSCLQIHAQTYRIDTSIINFENKDRPALYVKYDATPKTVKKAWDDFFNKQYNVKVKGIGFMTNKEVLTATGISLTAISDSKMNMYASIMDAPGERSELKYFISIGVDTFIGPDNYATEFASMKKILNDFSMEFLTDYYGSEASRITREISGLEKDMKKNSRDIKQNTKKARKKSSEVASGMQAKNTSLQMENDQKRIKIGELSKEIEAIKLKQAGLKRS